MSNESFFGLGVLLVIVGSAAICGFIWSFPVVFTLLPIQIVKLIVLSVCFGMIGSILKGFFIGVIKAMIK